MTTNHKKFRMGLVGCGRISQAYLDAIAVSEGVELAAVMDVRPEAALAAAEATGARAFSDLDEFAEQSDIEGAIICAPPIGHRQVSCTLMDRGIHVLCEKPIATRLDDAVDMLETANRLGLVLMMASKFRYVEDVIRAKAIIASGMLGEIHFYENVFCAKVDMRKRWNSDASIAGGGVLIDNGTHSVDIVRYLLGPIGRVFAHGSTAGSGLEVEDTVNLGFITESNVMGSIRLSWNIHLDSPTYVEIQGTEGALRVGWQESAYQHSGHPQWVRFGVGYDKVSAFANQVTNFVETIRGSADPLITAADGVSSVLAVEAAYRSMDTGNWVDVEGRSSQPTIAVAK